MNVDLELTKTRRIAEKILKILCQQANKLAIMSHLKMLNGSFNCLILHNPFLSYHLASTHVSDCYFRCYLKTGLTS